MPEIPSPSLTVLEVISPNGSRSAINVVNTPFMIGRGKEGNNLPLDDQRISRQCAALLSEDGRYFLKDRGHRGGLFVNGEQITNRSLKRRSLASTCTRRPISRWGPRRGSPACT